MKWLGRAGGMTSERATHHGYRFPAEVIRHATWLCHLFAPSLRDVAALGSSRHASLCASFGAVIRASGLVLELAAGPALARPSHHGPIWRRPLLMGAFWAWRRGGDRTWAC
jgi:hypothetical protein